MFSNSAIVVYGALRAKRQTALNPDLIAPLVTCVMSNEVLYFDTCMLAD